LGSKRQTRPDRSREHEKRDDGSVVFVGKGFGKQDHLRGGEPDGGPRRRGKNGPDKLSSLPEQWAKKEEGLERIKKLHQKLSSAEVKDHLSRSEREGRRGHVILKDKAREVKDWVRYGGGRGFSCDTALSREVGGGKGGGNHRTSGQDAFPHGWIRGSVLRGSQRQRILKKKVFKSQRGPIGHETKKKGERELQRRR